MLLHCSAALMLIAKLSQGQGHVTLQNNADCPCVVEATERTECRLLLEQKAVAIFYL